MNQINDVRADLDTISFRIHNKKKDQMSRLRDLLHCNIPQKLQDVISCGH